MPSYLCNICGNRIDDNDKVCPKCGAVNTRNIEVAEEIVKQYDSKKKKLQHFNNSLFVVSFIIGIALMIVDLVLLFDGNPVAQISMFICTIASGLMAFSSLIGLIKGEPVAKLVCISGSTSILLLLCNLIFFL